MKKSKIYSNIILLLAAILVLSGCSRSIMIRTMPVDGPDDQHAMVTFIRPSYYKSALDVDIWDGEKFVGSIGEASYIQHLAKPGKHLFLAKGESWSYVDANLKAGKQYYVLVKIAVGFLTPRIILDPIVKKDKVNRSHIDRWLAKSQPTAVMDIKVEAYTRGKIPKVNKAISRFYSGNAKARVLVAEDYR